MAPVLLPPASARYVVGLAGVAEYCAYQPSSVPLSVQAFVVPDVASESKSCV